MIALHHRPRTAIAAGILLLLVATLALLLAGRGGGQAAIADAPPATLGPVAESDVLTGSASPDALGNGSLFSADTAAAEGAELSARVPLPSGGTFGQIIWSDATALGPISEADIEGLLEFNAACQWWSAAYADGADPLVAAVVGEIPQWPTFRDGDRHTTAAEVAAGGDALLAAARYCDQSSRHAQAIIAQRGHQ